MIQYVLKHLQSERMHLPVFIYLTALTGNVQNKQIHKGTEKVDYELSGACEWEGMAAIGIGLPSEVK